MTSVLVYVSHEWVSSNVAGRNPGAGLRSISLWHRVFSRAHMTAGKMKPFTVPELTEAHLPKPQDGVSLTLCPLLKVHLIRSSLLTKSVLHNSKSAHSQPEISFSTNELRKGGSCGSFPSKAAIPCRGGGRGRTEGFVEEAPAFSSLSL